jgi:PAS domain-containing protein
MIKSSTRTARPLLRLVPPLEREPEAPPVMFCSHCGTRPAAADVRAASSRVCAECGFGLILQASADVAPHAGDAFLLLDRSLSVCAVSRAAERLLGTSEPDVVNRHITSLLMAADAEPTGSGSLAAAVAWAARGDGGTRSVMVRPANTFGIRLTARISACGPPRAALLVLA